MKFKKTLLSLILSGAIIFTSVVSYGSKFLGLEGHWSRFYVERLENKNIINGYQTQHGDFFLPDRYISREEASTVLSKYIGEAQTGKSSLKDIENRWSTSFIKNLLDKKIINGYEDGTFRPEKNMTRGEFATILSKYLDMEGKSYNSNNVNVIDIEGNWAQKGIENVIKYGFMSGYPDNTFKPNNLITRGEVVSTIALIDGAYKAKDFTDDQNKISEINKFISNAFGGKITLYDNYYYRLIMNRGEITDTDILYFLGQKMWNENSESFLKDSKNNLFSLEMKQNEVDEYSLKYFGRTIDHNSTELKITNTGNYVGQNDGKGSTKLFRDDLSIGVKDSLKIFGLKEVEKEVYIARVRIDIAEAECQFLIENIDGDYAITEVIQMP